MAQWVTERLYGGVGDNELDGGGLIQRKGSSRAIQRKSKPRERPVVQVRVREQRSVLTPHGFERWNFRDNLVGLTRYHYE